MGRINVLDKQVANMIAAGEVVENPASAAKELVENAIDAGASSVTVEIQNGGITYLRVTDDGCGMENDDAKTAFLRHATSKISNAGDLVGIKTLGFRGEALAAISSVSKIDLITKPRGGEIGTALRVEAGQIIRESESGCPDGTTIIVRELFYNTPARMRFLRKDATEAGAVENAVKSAALSHPEVSVKMIKDGKDVLHTPGDGTLKSCIYALFGRDFALNMKEVKTEEHGMSICGFACVPTATRGNRSMQFFFINGRPVKSRMLAVALETAYKERIMKGKFPTCVLSITMPEDLVDVNVHPAKTEVKFARERDVFDIVYFGVKSALDSDARETFKTQEVQTAPIDNVTQNQQKIFTEERKPEIKPFLKSEEAPPKTENRVQTVEYTRSIPHSYEEMKKQRFKFSADFAPSAKCEIHASEQVTEKTEPAVPKKEIQKPMPTPENPPITERKKARYIGEAMNTYIIAEYNDEIIMIDKHAAHERINFEKLKANYGKMQTQMLLSPEVIDLDKTIACALLDNIDEVEKLGFEISDFGDGSVAVSAVPDGIEANDSESVLEKIGEMLKNGERARTPEKLDEIMYSVACKAAIKAGQKNSEEELKKLLDRVIEDDGIRYCPHGRPIIAVFGKNELERKFKRQV